MKRVQRENEKERNREGRKEGRKMWLKETYIQII
jgi:hypothetical protein